jgi:hypothetical protein
MNIAGRNRCLGFTVHCSLFTVHSLKLLLIAAVLAPAVGCSWMRDRWGDSDQGRAPRGTGKLPDVTAEQLVGYLNDRAGRLQSVQYGEVRLRCYDKGMPVPVLRGDLVAAQPRNFRLVGQGAMGGKVDLGSNPEQFWVYVNDPTSRPVYVFASHTDFESGRAKLPGGIPFEPDWVMQALGMTALPPNNDYKVTPNDRDRTYTLSWEAQTPAGLRVRKEVVFDGDAATGTRSQVKRHVVKDAKSNKVICYAEIRAARAVTPEADSRAAEPGPRPVLQYPTHVVLKWEEQKFEMDLALDQARVNQSLSDEQARRLFTRPTVRGTNPVDLAH